MKKSLIILICLLFTSSAYGQENAGIQFELSPVIQQNREQKQVQIKQQVQIQRYQPEQKQQIETETEPVQYQTKEQTNLNNTIDINTEDPNKLIRQVQQLEQPLEMEQIDPAEAKKIHKKLEKKQKQDKTKTKEKAKDKIKETKKTRAEKKAEKKAERENDFELIEVEIEEVPEREDTEHTVEYSKEDDYKYMHEMLKIYEKKYQENNQNVANILKLAKIHLDLGQRSIAKSYYMQLYNTYPNDPKIQFEMGKFYYQCKQYNAALEFFKLSLSSGYIRNIEVNEYTQKTYAKLGDEANATLYGQIIEHLQGK